MVDSTPSPEARLLSRSLFPLALLGTLGSFIIGGFVLNIQTRDNIRLILFAGYALLLLVSVVLCVFILRSSEEQWVNRLIPFIKRVSRPLPALLLILLILEVNLVGIALTSGITPNMLPLIAALVLWSILIGCTILIAASSQIRQLLAKSRSFWSNLGLTFVIVVALLTCTIGTNLLLGGVIDRIRGSSDFRQLVFYGGEINADRSRAYWQELSELHAVWLPYTYHRFDGHTGEQINITPVGLRQTITFSDTPADAPKIFFFGGSTMWGEGSRDSYTIPSQIASMLHDQAIPAHVTNYGQVAYVTVQDLILFQRQLALGNIPDVAVFYGGFNDMVATSYYDGAAGLPHNETDRIRDWITGQTLRQGRPVLRQTADNVDSINLELIAIENATADQIVELYLNNLRLIRSAAAEYGVKALFVWQPSLHYKVNMTPEEQLLREENQRNFPGFEALYTEVDSILRQRIENEDLTDVLDLSQLFASTPDYTFYDRVHVIEDGNTRIADAILPALTSLME